MADLPILKFAGLYTSANEFSATPEGALIQADNVVIRSQGVIESRRGQAPQSYPFGSTPSRANALFGFGSSRILHYTSGASSANAGTKLAYDTGSAWTDYSGTIEAPEPSLLRMKAVEAGQNLYLTTSDGVKSIETVSDSPRTSGVYRGLAPSVSLPVASGTWLPDDSAAAYRIVWGRMDAHGTMHLGEPSSRSIIVNASGSTKDVTLSIPIPVEATTSDFYRIYRSENTANATVDPGDELYLCYENQATAAQITAGTISVTDIAPEILLFDPLYTNPSQPGGFLQANARPPKCRDMESWGGRVWFSNTELVQRLEFQLLAPFDTGDAIVIFGQNYSADFSGGGSGMGDAFDLDYTSLTTSAQKIQYCAQQLAYTINLRNRLGVGNQNYGDIRATLISGPNDPPGKILIEATGYEVAKGYLGVTATTIAASSLQPIPPTTFSITSASTSRASNVVTVTTTANHGYSVGDSVVLAASGVGTSFFYENEDSDFPTGIKTIASVPTSTTFTYAETGSDATLSTSYKVHLARDTASSNNDRCPNRLYFSKYQEPEAVPLLNYLDVGVKNQPIYRIKALRDRLFVFKPDGIFVVSGEYPFRVDLLDDTVRIISADSVASVNNAVYALTNQGVVAVSDAGVKIVSRPIERTLLQSEAFTQKEPTTFAIGYESERCYLLWLGNSDENYSEEAYVYNALVGAWTRWPIARACGFVFFDDDRLYLGSTSANEIWAERKDFSVTDYVDGAYDGTYTVDTKTSNLVFTTTTTITDRPSKGDGVLIDGTIYGVVESAAATTVTLSAVSHSFGAGASVVFYKAIPCNIEWAAQAPGGLDKIKQFPAATYHFRRNDFVLAEGTFATELSTSEQSPDITFSNYTFTGTGSWESRALPKNKRILVPRPNVSAYLAAGFKISEAWSIWALNGITIHHEDVGDGNSR